MYFRVQDRLKLEKQVKTLSHSPGLRDEASCMTGATGIRREGQSSALRMGPNGQGDPSVRKEEAQVTQGGNSGTGDKQESRWEDCDSRRKSGLCLRWVTFRRMQGL